MGAQNMLLRTGQDCCTICNTNDGSYESHGWIASDRQNGNGEISSNSSAQSPGNAGPKFSKKHLRAETTQSDAVETTDVCDEIRRISST